LGIRYVVVPKTDGAVSVVDDPLPLADGLLAAFENQLDIGSIYGPPSLEIYVNQAWFPVGAQLTGEAAEVSRLAGEQTIARSDLSGAVPSMVGADQGEPTAANEVAPGVVHLAIPRDDRLRLSVDGVELAPRTGFGLSTAFDIDRAGTGMLSYQRDRSRGWWLASQMMLWIALLVVAAGARSPFGRRRLATSHDETLIDLNDTEPLPGGVIGEALVPAVVDGDEVEEWAADDGPGGFSPPDPGVPAVDEGVLPSDLGDDDVGLASLVANLDVSEIDQPEISADDIDDDPEWNGGS